MLATRTGSSRVTTTGGTLSFFWVVVAAATAGSFGARFAEGRMGMGRWTEVPPAGSFGPQDPPPPKTNLGLRPWHDPIGAFVEGSVVLGSRRVKGREDVAVLRHYVSQTDPHDVFAHFNVVHNLRALWANHLARHNLFQLAAGHHAMQHYARRVLSQNMFGMMR